MAYNVLCGDAFSRLKEFPDNHFDSCVLDGPYGLSFMGKSWDTFSADNSDKRTKAKARKNGIRTGIGKPSGESSSFTAGEYDRSSESNRNFQLWFTDLAREILRVLKPGAYFLSFGGTRTFHRMISGIEDAGFEIRDCIMWTFGSGFPKSYNLTDELGTALKPSWEPICMARKPLEGTIEQNYKKWGTGVLNISRTRVPGEPWTFGTQTDIKGGRYGDSRPSDGDVYAKNVVGGENGRWPANIIHDGSPEVMALFPETKSGTGAVMKESAKGYSPNALSKESRPAGTEMVTYGDQGSAARFFYCAKTSRSDRNEGLDHLPKKPLAAGNQAQAQVKRGVLDHAGDSGMNTVHMLQNNHPTVKPTKLMRYLVAMVTPPGGEVLDPCCGSGSTGKPAILEGFNVVLIDREQQWAEIAAARCAHATLVWNKLNKAGKQLSL